MRNYEDRTRLLNPIRKPEPLTKPLPTSKGVRLLNGKKTHGVRVLSKAR